MYRERRIATVAQHSQKTCFKRYEYVQNTETFSGISHNVVHRSCRYKKLLIVTSAWSYQSTTYVERSDDIINERSLWTVTERPQRMY